MNQLTQKRMKIMLIALGVVFGGIVAFNIIKGLFVHYLFTHYVPPAVSVSSVVAERQSWNPTITAVGNFVAVNGVDVNAQLGGKVTAIHFHSGQFVEKGSPLVDLDDSVDQSNLKFNEANLTLQKANYQRQIDLQKRNATAASSVDEALAKRLEAEANIEKSQAIINQKHIVAPFSGMLGIRQINIGQYVQPGQTNIVTLQSMDPIYLHFFIPEHLLGRVSLHQRITFSIEQAPKLRFQAEITAINSKVDANTHMVEIQATVDNCPIEQLGLYDATKPITCNHTQNEAHHVAQYLFVPGVFADIEIEEPAIPDVIVVPSTAISFTMYGDSVFVIEKNKAGHPDKKGKDVLTVKRVFVKTGAQRGNKTIIKEGIKAGDIVVATGELKLDDGTQVTLNNEVTLPDVKNIDDLGQ